MPTNTRTKAVAAAPTTKQIKLGAKTIFFNEEKHKFTDERGKMINSVTKFTGLIDKSGALIGWAIKLMKLFLLAMIDIGAEITAEKIEEAAKQHMIKKKEAGDIGTEIHKLAEKFIKGEKYELPTDERVVNGFNAFLDFQRQYKIKWLFSEEIVGYVVGQEVLYAGIVDALGEIDGKLVLIDFKSSKGIYSEMYFQVAAYQMAVEQMMKNGTIRDEVKKAVSKYKKIDYRLIVKFGKETGDFEFTELHEYEQDKKAFLGLVDAKMRLIEIDKNSN